VLIAFTIFKVVRREDWTDLDAVSEHPELLFFCKCVRPVWKVSSHFEYLENWSRGLDITWQPDRGDLTAHL
jgi:hypothetical protein